MKPKIKEAIALVLTRRGRRVHEGGRGRRVHGFAIIWKVLAGVALVAGAFAPSAFADPPEGGGSQSPVITELSVRWTRLPSGAHMENDDMVVDLKDCTSGGRGFEVYGQVVCSIVDDKIHAPGTIELRLPELILIGKNGVKIGQPGYVDPYALTEGWSSRIDEASGEIVIFNATDKAAVQSLLFDVRWWFAASDGVCVGDRVLGSSGLFQATARVGGDEGDAEFAQSNAVRIFFDTDARPKEAIVNFWMWFDEWHPAWGPAPLDAADYIYAMWYESYSMANATEPYEVIFDSTLDSGGEVIGVSPCVGDGIYNLINLRTILDFTDSAQTIINVPAFTSSGRLLYVRYPKSLFEGCTSHTFSDSLTVSVVSSSEHYTNTVSKSNSRLRYFGGRIVGLPDTDSFDISKYAQRDRYIGGADLLAQGKRVELAFDVSAYAECLHAVLPPGADPLAVSSYYGNLRTNVFEVIDDDFFVQRGSKRKLTADDYEITGLTFSNVANLGGGCALGCRSARTQILRISRYI